MDFTPFEHSYKGRNDKGSAAMDFVNQLISDFGNEPHFRDSNLYEGNVVVAIIAHKTPPLYKFNLLDKTTVREGLWEKLSTITRGPGNRRH